jgi:hypothetical protein
MPNTYTLISSTTLSSTASTVTFSAIANSYTDLVIRASIRDTNSLNNDRNLQWRINGTTTNYRQTQIQGSGSAVTTTRSTGATYFSADRTIPAALATANTFSSTEIYIPNYIVASNKPSSTFSVGEDNTTNAYLMAVANLWTDNAAINSITFVSDGPNYAVGSSFYLYGISKS